MTTKFNGIAFPFGKNSTAFPAAVSDEELIKQSLIQIIMTSKGERIMRPDFGSNAQSFVFANNTDLLSHLIEIDVRTSIFKFEPRVAVKSVVSTRKDNIISIDITYIIRSTGAESSVSVPITTPHI
jgi:hypothetical protein